MEPKLWMADDAWYDPTSSDAPFLILSNPRPQSRWPPSVIFQHFGRPVRVCHTGPFTVLVRNHNLLNPDQEGVHHA